MKASALLFIVAEVTNGLRTKGFIDANGDFITPNAEQDVELAVIIETALKNNGVDVPNKIDKVIQLIPLSLEIIK